MMKGITELLEELEEAVHERNRMFTERLQPGLPEAKIKRDLTRAAVKGDTQLLVTFYHWRNGMTLDQPLAMAKNGLCPGKPYYFLSLEMALGHLGHYAAVSAKYPEISQAVGRYFPVLWDGSNGWIAVDLASEQNRVILIDLKSRQPFREIYSSWTAFLDATIESNRGNNVLPCFRDA